MSGPVDPRSPRLARSAGEGAITDPHTLKEASVHAERILDVLHRAGIKDDAKTFVALFIINALSDAKRPAYLQLGPDRIARLAKGMRVIFGPAMEEAKKEDGCGEQS